MGGNGIVEPSRFDSSTGTRYAYDHKQCGDHYEVGACNISNRIEMSIDIQVKGKVVNHVADNFFKQNGVQDTGSSIVLRRATNTTD